MRGIGFRGVALPAKKIDLDRHDRIVPLLLDEKEEQDVQRTLLL